MADAVAAKGLEVELIVFEGEGHGFRRAETIERAGGTVALPKYALPGMAWQGYFHDTANNVFGIHQPDPNAA